MHPPAEALPRLPHLHQGPGALQLVGAAKATKAGANDHHSRRPIPGRGTAPAFRQHQGGASGHAAESKLPAAPGRGPGACSSGELVDQTSAHIQLNKISNQIIQRCKAKINVDDMLDGDVEKCI